MKLRTRAGSIRLRLGQREVARLAEEGAVEEAIVIGPGPEDRLVYRLALDDAQPELARARLAGARLEVRLAAAEARRWATGADVGLEAVQGSGPTALAILVEKDFACLEPRGEDADAYPHPLAAGREARS